MEQSNNDAPLDILTATWDPSVNAAYIYVNPTGRVVRTASSAPATVNLDLDEQGEIVGIEVLL